MKITVEMDIKEFDDYRFYQKLDKEKSAKTYFYLKKVFDELKESNNNNYNKTTIIESIKNLEYIVLKRLGELDNEN